ncbi:FlgD immunoglobulin-like domain containing protein [Candidatus Neomarinimicrobiota bacterium]
MNDSGKEYGISRRTEVPVKQTRQMRHGVLIGQYQKAAYLRNAIAKSPDSVNTISVRQNYPNASNPETRIQYDLPEAASVNLIIYDILGREVIKLLDQQMSSGYHTIIWDGRDRTGRTMPSGMYFARMGSPSYTITIKMILERETR